MRRLSVVLAVGVSLGILGGWTPSAWAKATGFGQSCVIDNPGGGAIALRGTVALEAFNTNAPTFQPVDMDVVLRLERGGVLKFYHVHIVAPIVINEELVCEFLPHEDSTGDVANVLGPAIRDDFGLGTRNLCITDKSLSKAEADPIFEFPAISVAPVRALSMADLTVYAIEGKCTPP